MHRRELLRYTTAALAAPLLDACRTPVASRSDSEKLDPAWFAANRHFLPLPVGRIAYVERGSGPVALFLHGAPLNGFQWRGSQTHLQ